MTSPTWNRSVQHEQTERIGRDAREHGLTERPVPEGESYVEYAVDRGVGSREYAVDRGVGAREYAVEDLLYAVERTQRPRPNPADSSPAGGTWQP